MSYSHTKRRKTIAKLKKDFPIAWKQKLREIGDAVCKRQDGLLIGSLEQVLQGNK